MKTDRKPIEGTENVYATEAAAALIADEQIPALLAAVRAELAGTTGSIRVVMAGGAPLLVHARRHVETRAVREVTLATLGEPTAPEWCLNVELSDVERVATAGALGRGSGRARNRQPCPGPSPVVRNLTGGSERISARAAEADSAAFFAFLPPPSSQSSQSCDRERPQRAHARRALARGVRPRHRAAAAAACFIGAGDTAAVW